MHRRNLIPVRYEVDPTSSPMFPKWRPVYERRDDIDLADYDQPAPTEQDPTAIDPHEHHWSHD